jgi:Transcription factor TFIIH complex subunit Tfb5
MASSIRAARGVLVTSDEPTIVFISLLSESLPTPQRFIVRKLDGCNLLVKRDAIPYIRENLAARLMQGTFDEDEENADAAAASSKN